MHGLSVRKESPRNKDQNKVSGLVRGLGMASWKKQHFGLRAKGRGKVNQVWRRQGGGRGGWHPPRCRSREWTRQCPAHLPAQESSSATEQVPLTPTCRLGLGLDPQLCGARRLWEPPQFPSLGDSTPSHASCYVLALTVPCVIPAPGSQIWLEGALVSRCPVGSPPACG